MKVAVISESPSLTTGFGIVCNQIVRALASAQHEVSCFGINALGETFDRPSIPARVWAVGETELIPKFSTFLHYEQPDILVFNMDIVTLQMWTLITKSINWNGPLVAHFVMDGLPIDKRYIDFLATVERKITPTKVAAAFLESHGLGNVIVAP